MNAIESASNRAIRPQWIPSFVWLTFAVSCVVFIEPAPYDVLVLILFGVLLLRGLRVPREAGKAVFLLALFTLGNLIGTVASGDPEVSLRPLITRTYMLLTWVFFVALIVAEPRTVMSVLWRGYTFAALLAAVWGALEYYDLLPGFMVGDSFGRAKGPFKDPNVFGPFLVPVAMHLVSRILRSRGSVLLVQATMFLIVAFGLLLSFSRGAWINFAFSFGIYMMLSIATAPTLKEKVRLVGLIVVLSFTASVCLTWAVNNTAAGQRFADRAILFKSYDLETGGRFDTQYRVLHEVGIRPLGVGPGMSTPEFGMEPHNVYLHTAIEGGWLAAVAFYLFLLLILFRGITRVGFRWELQGDLHVLLATLSGTLFQSLFIDSTHWRHLWVLLAVVFALTISVDRGRARLQNHVMFNAA